MLNRKCTSEDINFRIEQWFDEIQSLHIFNEKNIKKVKISKNLYNYLLNKARNEWNKWCVEDYIPEISTIFGMPIEIDEGLTDYEYQFEYNK